jgi:ABC-type sugar transport system permease subunit
VYNFLKNLNFYQKFSLMKKLLKKKPFFNKFRKLQYFGIFALASLPVYTGGICAASLLRYISKNLNRKKSFIVMMFGSLTGCIIWVYGINYLFVIISYILKFIL